MVIAAPTYYNERMSETIIHPFKPVADESSRLLILGTFPSVKSREEGFYYGHPRNRFWPLMEALFSVRLETIEDKRSFLLERHIALWDTIASCRIEGSADSSIKDIIANDIEGLIQETRIGIIVTNGRKADDTYHRYIHLHDDVMMPTLCLPSTSPANASWSFDRLLERWSIIKSFIDK